MQSSTSSPERPAIHVTYPLEGGNLTSPKVHAANGKLFVYGALLDSSERRRLLGRSVNGEPARLEGYARGRSRYFFVTPRENSVVEGEILSGLSDVDIAILDEYEEVPRLYIREQIEVVASDGKLSGCWIYLPAGWERG